MRYGASSAICLSYLGGGSLPLRGYLPEMRGKCGLAKSLGARPGSYDRLLASAADILRIALSRAHSDIGQIRRYPLGRHPVVDAQ